MHKAAVTPEDRILTYISRYENKTWPVVAVKKEIRLTYKCLHSLHLFKTYLTLQWCKTEICRN